MFKNADFQSTAIEKKGLSERRVSDGGVLNTLSEINQVLSYVKQKDILLKNPLIEGV